MKRYTGPLSPRIEALVKNNLKYLKGLAAPGLSRPSSLTYSIDETVKKYNPGITEDEVKAWVWFRRKQGVPMTSWKSYFVKETKSLLFAWLQKEVIFFDPTHDAYVPYPVFVFGNLYSKITGLKQRQDQLEEELGPEIFRKHIEALEKIRPEMLSISNPVASERPVILAISEFPKEYYVSSLKESTGVILEAPVTLLEAYKDYLRALPDEAIRRTTAYQVINYYLENDSKPRTIDKIEWNKIKKNTKEEGERLFKDFLHEALEYSDQQKVDIHYNEKYNATAPLQYQKIPIGLEVSREFMGNTLEVREAQREGIAFMELVGSGIIAYDVGVGKTITAIIEVVTAIKNGKCKRPLIAVPNPTYKNWIKEMLGDDELAGVLTGTGITVNDWFNLGVNYDGINLDKKVKENSITLVSYEGLMNIGFNEHTAEDHFNELSDILGQSEEGSARDAEKRNEKYREIVGVGIADTIADIETLGFDYVVIDEAHNFKNVFSEVKSNKDGKKNFHVKGGKPSNRAVKAFFLCNYIQRKFGRNVMLLTATPFTNSPLEIYSMLSLVAFQYMKKNNIENLTVFFEQYIQETIEYVVKQDGKISQNDVVKSFNNRISLQKLINSHINFKTGEEANIPRPCKVNLPKTTEVDDAGMVTNLPMNEQVLTYLRQGEIQAEMQAEINKLASEGADRDDPGRLLSLMADSQNNALSPYLVGKSEKSKLKHMALDAPEDYKEFIENSPKIKYAMDCISSVKKHHEKEGTPVSSQVVYIDRGKEYFPLIKEYLIKELGYKRNRPMKDNARMKVDEVEFMQGGMNSDKKAKITQAFNEGTCKIIIGTSTIKEGVNLQERSTVLYNLYPNWNPTDLRQLEGRVWRQKNKFNFVRIVMPLMENSMDVFVFQKLEEKTSRINDLWTKSERGNVLDEESLDPNEVKLALVTDMNVLVDYELKQIKEELDNTRHVVSKKLEDLKNYSDLQYRYVQLKERNLSDLRSHLTSFPRQLVSDAGGRHILFQDIPTLEMEDLPKTITDDIERFQKVYDSLQEVNQGNFTDKELIRAISAHERVTARNSYGYGRYNYQFDSYKETVSQLAKIKKSLFQDRGYDENTDIEKIKAELQLELEAAQAEIDEITSMEFQEEVYNRILERKAKFGVTASSVEQRVKEFKEMNHLLDYKFEKTSALQCKIPANNIIKPGKPAKTDDAKQKMLKLKLAKAKAKAIKIKLKLQAA